MRSRFVRVLAAAMLGANACGGGGSSVAAPTPPAIGLGPFLMALPIAPGDSASVAYAIWPFGVHSGGHAPDGHPGFDIEYRSGAMVLAAADGIVTSVTPDAHDPSRSRVQLRHPRDRGDYMTDYSNLAGVIVSAGAIVSRGQALGAAGTFVDGRSGMTHFQVADPTRSQPAVPESAIVSPQGFLTDAARADLDGIWATAAYRAEWCEPFLTNPRGATFPLTRTWTADNAGAVTRIVVTCPNDTADMTWVAYAGDAAVEQGTVSLNFSARPTTLDVRLSTGETRRGLYDIVSGTLRLALAAPGQPRPAALDAAARFSSVNPD
jgi:hypothetical protein